MLVSFQPVGKFLRLRHYKRNCDPATPDKRQESGKGKAVEADPRSDCGQREGQEPHGCRTTRTISKTGSRATNRSTNTTKRATVRGSHGSVRGRPIRSSGGATNDRSVRGTGIGGATKSRARGSSRVGNAEQDRHQQSRHGASDMAPQGDIARSECVAKIHRDQYEWSDEILASEARETQKHHTERIANGRGATHRGPWLHQEARQRSTTRTGHHGPSDNPRAVEPLQLPPDQEDQEHVEQQVHQPKVHHGGGQDSPPLPISGHPPRVQKQRPTPVTRVANGIGQTAGLQRCACEDHAAQHHERRCYRRSG